MPLELTDLTSPVRKERESWEERDRELLERVHQEATSMAETSGPLHAALLTVRQTNAAHVSALDALERAFTAETALFGCVSRF